MILIQICSQNFYKQSKSKKQKQKTQNTLSHDSEVVLYQLYP